MTSIKSLVNVKGESQQHEGQWVDEVLRLGGLSQTSHVHTGMDLSNNK